jgi:serine/threonine protein kinase
MSDLLGSVLGGAYRIDRFLSEGAMGVIYEATHTRLETRFAIKVLQLNLSKYPEAQTRFKREAMIGSRLRHENIVQVIDFNFTPDGAPYLVMELLEGENLEAVCKREGRLQLERAAAIAWQVGRALCAAHEEGIIHRDLKPENVFLCPRRDGTVTAKVVDFGISKMLDSESLVTQNSSLLGTPAYMSPEQAVGLIHLVDHRSDLFALGGILYRMLTGVSPFAAPSIPTVLYRVVHEHPPSLEVVRRDVPPGLSKLVDRCLAKKRNQRIQSAAEFLDTLRAVMDGRVLSATKVQLSEISSVTVAPPSAEAAFPDLPLDPAFGGDGAKRTLSGTGAQFPIGEPTPVQPIPVLPGRGASAGSPSRELLVNVDLQGTLTSIVDEPDLFGMEIRTGPPLPPESARGGAHSTGPQLPSTPSRPRVAAASRPGAEVRTGPPLPPERRPPTFASRSADGAETPAGDSLQLSDEDLLEIPRTFPTALEAVERPYLDTAEAHSRHQKTTLNTAVGELQRSPSRRKAAWIGSIVTLVVLAAAGGMLLSSALRDRDAPEKKLAAADGKHAPRAETPPAARAVEEHSAPAPTTAPAPRAVPEEKIAPAVEEPPAARPAEPRPPRERHPARAGKASAKAATAEAPEPGKTTTGGSGVKASLSVVALREGEEVVADVYLDGKKVDQTPAVIRDLVPGDHTVVLKGGGIGEERRQVRLGAGEKKRLVVAFEKK